MFGGINSADGNCAPCTRLKDVWLLTNANGTEPGTQEWVQLSPTGSLPPGRSAALVTYDASANRLIVLGGLGESNHVLGDVWVLTNANGVGGQAAWEQITPAGNGPVRYSLAGGYDSLTNRLIVSGGLEVYSGSDINDTWVLTNANGTGGESRWQTLNPSGNLPEPRDGAASAYDSATNRLIVSGGQDSSSKTPLNGTWVLTDANGTVNSQLQVNQILPKNGGNAGTVTVELLGSGFQPGTTVKLTGLGADVVGVNATVPNSSVLTTTFDLRGAAPGLRSVVVTNTDGTSITSEAAFTVEQGGAPDLSVNIIGRNQIRIGSDQTYYVSIHNNGSVDAPFVEADVNQPFSSAASIRSGGPAVANQTPSGAVAG
jgi:hypothetical protein